MNFETLLIEAPAEGVALIRLNRPRQYNALNTTLLGELGAALEQFETDDAVKVVIITGSEKAFAAGADIAEMVGKSGEEMLQMIQSVTGWKAISTFSKPTICSVSGMALGGGFAIFYSLPKVLSLPCRKLIWALSQARVVRNALPD